MGQKTNPIIFRLGKTKEWNAKYCEKKTKESSTIIFKNLEIRKFIFRLFFKNKLYIQDCKTYYSENVIHIYISYYNSEQSLLKKNSLKKRLKIQPKAKISSLFRDKTKDIKKISSKKKIYLAKAYWDNFAKTNSELEQMLSLYLYQKKSHRFQPIQAFKTYIDNKKYKRLQSQALNLFTYKVLKAISLFTQGKQNISLHLKQLNTEDNLCLKIDEKRKRKIVRKSMALRKFQDNDFFVEGLNLVYNTYSSTPNPKLLADFIALYLKKLKRPNFFLRFIKLALNLLQTKRFSQIERIQIKIKGRFNGAPRSRHRFINIGKNVPVFTLRAKINYGESTAFTSNGTFGVKVWTYTKSKNSRNDNV